MNGGVKMLFVMDLFLRPLALPSYSTAPSSQMIYFCRQLQPQQHRNGLNPSVSPPHHQVSSVGAGMDVPRESAVGSRHDGCDAQPNSAVCSEGCVRRAHEFNLAFVFEKLTKF